MINIVRAICSILFISIISCTSQESRKETTAVPAVVESGIEILTQSKSDTLKGSLKAMSMGIVGATHVQID